MKYIFKFLTILGLMFWGVAVHTYTYKITNYTPQAIFIRVEKYDQPADTFYLMPAGSPFIEGITHRGHGVVGDSLERDAAYLKQITGYALDPWDLDKPGRDLRGYVKRLQESSVGSRQNSVVGLRGYNFVVTMSIDDKGDAQFTVEEKTDRTMEKLAKEGLL